MPLTITASVGKGGSNQYSDVRLVQQLLNKNRNARLVEDGKIGPMTIQAISDFQKGFLSQPDGRIDPGGTTWKKLAGGDGPALVLLPQMCGHGYYSYSPANRQYGTIETIQALRDVAATFKLNAPDTLIAIGDISFADGAVMSPHESHRKGLNVDIRPIRKDKAQTPCSITDAQYDRDATRLLVESLLAHRNVKSILFNDSEIQGVSNWAGHHNHLHVTMKS